MSRKKDVIYTLDHDLIKLKQLGLSVVSLANNHFFDLGAEGAAHTIQLLDKMGIGHVGAGKTLAEASQPYVAEVGGKRVAITAFCDCTEERIGWVPVATDSQAGVNPLNGEYVVSEIKRLKETYDYVVVMPHWGKEGQILPTDYQYRLAKKMVESGADLVLGSHTHCIQPAVSMQRKAVAFGMGNFLFPDRLIAPPRSTFYPEDSLEISALPVTDRYPYVETVTFKKWKTKARYGSIVECELDDDGSAVSPYVVQLSSDNRLDLVGSQYPYAKQLKVAASAVKSGLFPQLYVIQKLLNSTKRVVKKYVRILGKA